METFNEWIAKLKKLTEAEAIVSSCKPTASFQVYGACSDLKKKKKNGKKK